MFYQSDEKTKLSTKGQIILPKSVRDSQNWEAGTEFTVEATAEGVLLRPVKRLPVTTLDQVAGCLRRTGKTKTIAQMNTAIGREIQRRHDSGRY
jgi:AbrB family looped-hinge helix DNA binding protein